MSESPGGLVVRGGLSSGLGFLVRFFARLLFLFVAGRLFGSALFGAYSLAVALVEIAVIAGGLGTRWLLFDWLEEHAGNGSGRTAHAVADAALIVASASALIALAAMLTVALLPAPLIAPNSAAAIFWLAPMIVPQALIELLLAATRWTQVMRYEVIGKSLVQPYAGVIAALIAWRAGAQAHGLIISYIVGTIAAFGYALFALHRTFGFAGLAGWRPGFAALARRRTAIAANSGSDLAEALFLRIDIYAVGILLGESAAGIYAMARQLSISLRQVRQSFDGMLVPLMARTVAAAEMTSIRDALASTSRLILIVQLPIVILYCVAGEGLLGLFGHGFTAGYDALVCLAVAEAIQGAFGVGDMLFVYRRPLLGMAITLSSALIGLVGLLLLTPRFGVGGAGAAMLLCASLRALARRHFLGARFGLTISPRQYWGIGAAAISIAVGLAINGAFLATVAALATYIVIVWLWLRASGTRLTPQGLAQSPIRR